jgi:hypothetical protein
MPILNTTQIITLTAGGGTENLDVLGQPSLYVVQGTATLTSNWTIQPTGTPLQGTEFVFRYEANIDLDGNTITVFGTTMPETVVDKSHNISAYWDGANWEVNFTPDLDEAGSIPLSVVQGNGWSTIPAVTEVMLNGDNSPTIENSIQAEGTTQSKLYYKVNPNSKTLNISGVVDVVNIDETAVSGTLSVIVLNFLSGITTNLGSFLNIPILAEYQISGTAEANSGASSPSFKAGYLQKGGTFAPLNLVIPSANLGTSVTARYSAYIDITIQYS